MEDWADQDLLTKDEARDRLGVAVTRAQNRLARVESPDNEAKYPLGHTAAATMETVGGEYDAQLHNQH